MITIALDEGEHFEKPKGCMFVGGIVFEHKAYKEMDRERARLKKYFMKVCEEQGCNYPEDLHYNWSDNTVINAERASRVKAALEKSLPDFIQGKGDWKQEPPFGEYRLFALLGDQKGMESFCKPGISNLIDDNIACNRYEHMAYRTVENLLFYNLYQVDDKIKLELPTRIIKPDKDPKLIDEVKRLGLSKSNPQANDNRYQVTDSGSFRAALASSIQNSDRKDIQFDINVQSINYKESAINNNVDLFQSFLYLADTVCSLFSNHIHTINSCYKALEELKITCRKVTGKRNFLWAYDEIDQIYRIAYDEIRYGNYFEALLKLYEGILEKPDFIPIYNEIWFQPLLDNLCKNVDVFSWKKAIEKLELYLYSPNYDVSKAEYIFEILKRMAETDNDLYKTHLFYLYKIEMILFNHKGDYAKAEIYAKKCVEYSNYVPVEEYLEIRNMVSVFLIDKGSYNEAVSFTQETVSYEEMLVSLRKELHPNSKNVYVRYGKSLSQLGQCYSYAKDYEQAENSFIQALELFGGDVINYQITLSYYLHLMIEKRDIDKYEKYACLYFGTTDLKKQFKNIFKMESTTIRFALFVYTKALFVFYVDKESKGFIKEVIMRTLQQYEKTEHGHPWELIIKYCAFLSIKNKNSIDSSKGLMVKAEEAVTPATGRILSILTAGKMEFDQLKGGLFPSSYSDCVYMFH